MKIDRLLEIARNPTQSLIRTGVVTAQNRRAVFSYPVRSGQRYSAALKWFRRNVATIGTSLKLQVEINGQKLIDETSFALSRGRFVAPSTGLATVTIEVNRYDAAVPSHVYSVVVTAESRRYVAGSTRSFGHGCGPRLVFGDDPMPYLGRTYALELTATAHPSALSVLTLGASDRFLRGVRLPLDLGPYGAPRCYLRNSAEMMLPIPVRGTPRRIVVGVPRLPVLLGGTIHHQALVFTNSNALGVAVSDAHSVTIGG